MYITLFFNGYAGLTLISSGLFYIYIFWVIKQLFNRVRWGIGTTLITFTTVSRCIKNCTSFPGVTEISHFVRKCFKTYVVSTPHLFIVEKQFLNLSSYQNCIERIFYCLKILFQGNAKMVLYICFSLCCFCKNSSVIWSHLGQRIRSQCKNSLTFLYTLF